VNYQCYYNFILLNLERSLSVQSCEPQWKQFNNKCYRIFSDKGLINNFDDAFEICSKNNSALITIDSIEEENFLINYLNKSNSFVENVWIGFRYDTDGYKWNDTIKRNYQNWPVGHPKHGSGYCTQLNSDEDNLGKWEEVLCNQKVGLVVCQKYPNISLTELINMVYSLKDKCDKNDDSVKMVNDDRILIKNILLNWVRYKSFIDSNNQMKTLFVPLSKNISAHYNEAVDLCNKSNATLVEIESEDKQKIVESFLKDIVNQGLVEYKYFWINGYRDSSGSFMWQRSGKYFNYNNWLTGYPKIGANFVYITLNSAHFGKWVSSDMTDMNSVLCEMSIVL
jgi:hypothetical protein